MKTFVTTLLLVFFGAALVGAQTVQVRIYAIHNLQSLKLKGIVSPLQLKNCVDCAGWSANEALLSAAANGINTTRGMSKELYVKGDYRLSTSDLVPFVGQFPLRIESKEGSLRVVARIPLEEYVEAVVAAESSDFKNSEAMKAMAVAARTYATRFSGQHAMEGFDFCDSTHCQAFSWNEVNNRVIAAVQATSGEILTFNGAPAETYYHQNCGGITADAHEVWNTKSVPYLVSHSDPYCSSVGAVKWESSIAIADIDAALRASGIFPPQRWQEIRVISRTASGRVKQVALSGSEPTLVRVSASSFRFAVNRWLGWNKIRSDLYVVRVGNGSVLFSGKGSGHGVGLCQSGADEMAREGKTYREILAFYYPGTQLSAKQVLDWQKQSDERFDLVSTEPQTDSSILPVAERLLGEDENAIGWRVPFRVRLQIYPTMDAYRDLTGEPGWVAASVKAHTIRIQPLLELQRKGAVESTLRHEFYHILVETHTTAVAPVWFREGLVLALSNPSARTGEKTPMSIAQMEAEIVDPSTRRSAEKAYSAASNRVQSLFKERGKRTVLGWLQTGIPSSALTGQTEGSDQ